MIQEIPTWLGVLSLTGMAGLVAFVIFAFHQGAKVKNQPQGVPPEVTPPFS
jgi:hypothetical protein